MSIFGQIVITSYNEILIFTTTISYAFAILKQQSFFERKLGRFCASKLLMIKRRRKWRTKSKRIIITAVIEYMSNKVS